MDELDVVLDLCAGGEGWRLDSNDQRGPEEHQDWTASGSGEAHQIPVNQRQGHTQGSITTGHEVKAVTSTPLAIGYRRVRVNRALHLLSITGGRLQAPVQTPLI